MAQFADVRSIEVGAFKITYLNDGGGLIVPTAMYPASTDKGWENYQDFLDDQGRIVVSIGGFLIETGDHKIVMDLGFGPMTVEFPGFGPFIGGKFLESLAQTGVAREDVTEVIYTHLHVDHVGWTSLEANGGRELTFPNARYLCTETEWNFWIGDETGMGPHPEAVQKPLEGKIEFISPGDDVVPGLTLLSTAGHTPGHISLRLDGGDQQVYLIADLLHSEVQFYEAEWGVVFDINAEQAHKTREGIYPTLAQPHVIVADGHFANRVFGRLTHEGDRWVWTPLE
jgi:glyoxylase-like metal-dependent hydrolase (beta-lactamase superfamily II)